jgi:STE24 endopeptidase
MNLWLIAVVLIILISYLLELTVAMLNLRALKPVLPEEFREIYDQQKYEKSQKYTRVTSRFSLLKNSITTVVTLAFLLLGGFNYVDVWARSLGYGEIVTGLLFTAALGVLSFLLSLPFSCYSTFVIEKNFGFNRTRIPTYLLDIAKGVLLTTVIGGPLLALVFWFFINSGSLGWVYCWIGVVLFSMVMQFLAPVLIMPLFNTFTPLDEGSLKEQITGYATKEKFQIQGIFTMDGSKRSAKLNAFFTGFGAFRKIVFFDTLIAKLTDEEIVAVLAHEMGHFKLKHIFKMMAASIIQMGITFFLLSLFINVPGITAAFGIDQPSIYASLVLFGFVYSPVSFLISLLFNIFSRKHEFEADDYAARTTGKPEQLISSLQKLSRENLSNLTPHPLQVFIHYSHPPLLERLNRLRSFLKQPEQI